MTSDVIIVGGGVSGLAAAVRLAEAGARVTLLERSPNLGGRCSSFRDEATGDIVDNGQHVLVGAYHRTLAYLDRIGTRGFLKPEESILIVDPARGRRGTLRFPRLPAPFHLAAGLLRFPLLSLSERWRSIDAGIYLRSWDEAKERALAGQSVDSWLRSIGQSEHARRTLWDPFCISIMNERPERASALLFARSLRAAFLGRRGDGDILIPTVGQSELYVEPAMRLLAANGASIRPGSEVQGLILEGGNVRGVRLADGSLLRAGAVIAAVPPQALARIIPESHAASAPFVSLGAFTSSPIVSIHLWLDRELLDADFVGLVGMDLQWVFNRRRLTGPGTTPGYLSAVISGAYRQVDCSKEELVALAVRDISAFVPAMRDARLLASRVIKEKRATFSATSEAEALRPSPRTPVGGLYLAGDWTNTGYPATIEGAIISGEAAAACAARAN